VPRPTEEAIVNLYGHDAAQVSADLHIADEYAKRLHARHHLRILRAIAPGGALLEIGAGAGYFLDEARRAGFDPYALEFNPVQAEHIRTSLGIPCAEAPLSAAVFPGQRFDVIYHCDVISHFFDPIAVFRAAYARLRDGGMMVFETGNLGDVDRRYFKFFQRFQYPDHLYFFSTGNLRTLLERTGFEVVGTHRYSILPQLRMQRALRGLKAALRRHVHSPSTHESIVPRVHQAAPSRDLESRGRTAFQAAARLSQYFEYLLRYRLGRIAPKAARPQTVIVVARRRAVSSVDPSPVR